MLHLLWLRSSVICSNLYPVNLLAKSCAKKHHKLCKISRDSFSGLAAIPEKRNGVHHSLAERGLNYQPCNIHKAFINVVWTVQSESFQLRGHILSLWNINTTLQVLNFELRFQQSPAEVFMNIMNRSCKVVMLVVVQIIESKSCFLQLIKIQLCYRTGEFVWNTLRFNFSFYLNVFYNQMYHWIQRLRPNERYDCPLRLIVPYLWKKVVCDSKYDECFRAIISQVLSNEFILRTLCLFVGLKPFWPVRTIARLRDIG